MEIRVGFQRDAPRFACAELPIARNESVVVRPASREAYQIPSTAGKMNSPIVSFDVPVKKKERKKERKESSLRDFDSSKKMKTIF